jgi:hypothetical protein
MSEQVLIPKDAESTETKKALSVNIDHDRLKYFFYMMNGEPSSRIETFSGAILVSKDDIKVLIDSLVNKLKLAHIRDYVIKVGVGFDKTIVEKSYADFLIAKWNEPSNTKEIIIKINCMYEDYDTGNPLNHSMFIRIARKINSGNLFQILASSDLSKLDEFDNIMAPVFCKTDYLDDELSKSLMGAVSEWHKGQKQPSIISKTLSFAKKQKEKIARFVHYVYPAVSAGVMCVAAFTASNLLAGNKNLAPSFLSILIVAVFLNSFFISYGARRARKLYESLSEISNQDVIFDITRGDDKENSERINDNKVLFSSAKGVFIWSLIQAVGASLIAASIFYFLTKSA